VICAETTEPIDVPFGLWTLVGRRKQVQLYSPGGANVPSNVGTLLPPSEYDSTVHSWRQYSLMSDYFDHLLDALLGCISVLRT